jgi:hypothetical protein
VVYAFKTFIQKALNEVFICFGHDLRAVNQSPEMGL